jgi:hypothetical protein
MPDAMARAMAIVQPVGPQGPARPGVEDEPGRPGGEHCAVDGDVPLQHPRERALLRGGGRAEAEHACDVGRAVQVLPARVAEVYLGEAEGGGLSAKVENWVWGVGGYNFDVDCVGGVGEEVEIGKVNEV